VSASSNHQYPPPFYLDPHLVPPSSHASTSESLLMRQFPARHSFTSANFVPQPCMTGTQQAPRNAVYTRNSQKFFFGAFGKVKSCPNRRSGVYFSFLRNMSVGLTSSQRLPISLKRFQCLPDPLRTIPARCALPLQDVPCWLLYQSWLERRAC